MYSEKIPARQLSAWLFTALTPVLIQYTSGSWTWTLMAGALAAVAGWLSWRFGRGGLAGGIVLLIVVGSMMKDAARCWPGDNYPAVPLILLALAAWSAWKGPSAAARTACVLFWAVLLIYIVVFASGVQGVELRWLKPRRPEPNWPLLLLLLVPSSSIPLLNKEGRWGIRLLLPILFAVAASMIVAGVLSPGLARELERPFYEMSRSLDLFGVAKRFEAVISAAMTVGWFCLMSLSLSLIAGGVKRWPKGAIVVAALAMAGWMLCDLHISGGILLLLATVFWVAFPILAQGIDFQKKS
ncbi:MAG: hypothetical protein IJV82_03980 [Oscillospiraceae bacterium]|nr:hypothetical protein [Oscillospiraceae bacterium]